MKRLMLLRHAKSSWDEDGVADRDRPLAPRGLRDAETMAEAIAKRKLLPNRILCSPALRTRQTLAALESYLPKGTAIAFVEELYSGPQDYRAAISATGAAADRLLVIGHNPRIQATALSLIGKASKPERARLTAKYPTGALAVIDFDIEAWATIAPGDGRLETFLRPRDLDETSDDD